MQLRPFLPNPDSGGRPPLQAAWEEVREIVWLAVITGALSVAAVGVAALVAAALN